MKQTTKEINRLRSSIGWRSVKFHQEISGGDYLRPVTDLLANLMHLCALDCDRFGSFENNLAMAKKHFETELETANEER
jgi:hypothetical protein